VTNEILCDKVIIDDKLAAYEAVKALSTRKKKNSLVTTVDYVVWVKLRTDGYIQSLIRQ
jgi:LacI family transcriptional regulator